MAFISVAAACTASLLGPITLMEALSDDSLTGIFSQDVSPTAQKSEENEILTYVKLVLISDTYCILIFA